MNVTKISERRKAVRNKNLIKNDSEAAKYRILLKIVQAANDRLVPGNVIRTIMDNIQRLIPCEAWSILLLSHDGDELVFEHARGERTNHLAFARLKMGEGIAGWVAQQKKAVIVNDVNRDQRFNSKFDQINQFRTRSVLCAPLISRTRVMGVVELINKKAKDSRFIKRDLRTLQTLLGPIAVSLHNALLFEESERLTITDDLTKLYNNRYVNQCVTRMIAEHGKRRRSFSLIFLDLDGFKTVNDRYGHLVGGKTLIEIGKVIYSSVRSGDLVARYGGDEFIVMMPDTAEEDAIALAEKLRLAIQDHDFEGLLEKDIQLSASFGISLFPRHAQNLTELIQKADRAMYAVKYSGKNAVQVAD